MPESPKSPQAEVEAVAAELECAGKCSVSGGIYGDEATSLAARLRALSWPEPQPLLSAYQPAPAPAIDREAGACARALCELLVALDQASARWTLNHDDMPPLFAAIAVASSVLAGQPEKPDARESCDSAELRLCVELLDPHRKGGERLWSDTLRRLLTELAERRDDKWCECGHLVKDHDMRPGAGGRCTADSDHGGCLCVRLQPLSSELEELKVLRSRRDRLDAALRGVKLPLPSGPETPTWGLMVVKEVEFWLRAWSDCRSAEWPNQHNYEYAARRLASARAALTAERAKAAEKMETPEAAYARGYADAEGLGNWQARQQDIAAAVERAEKEGGE